MSDSLTKAVPSPDVTHVPEPMVLGFDAPRTRTLFKTLSSSGGRQIVEVLATESLSPARITERVDTSLQNVHHHLSRLEAAGLVEIVATDISAKGREMDLYTLAGDPILVMAEDTLVVAITS